MPKTTTAKTNKSDSVKSEPYHRPSRKVGESNSPVSQSSDVLNSLDTQNSQLLQQVPANDVDEMDIDLEATSSSSPETLPRIDVEENAYDGLKKHIELLQEKKLLDNKENYLWKDKLKEIYDYIDKVDKILEDEEDINVLKSSNDCINKLAKKLQESTSNLDSFIKAHAREHVDKFMQEINGYYIELGKEFTNITGRFPLNEAGFSAKARAHEMEVKETEVDNYYEDKTWLEGITLGGESLKNKVYKKELQVEGEKASQAVVLGEIIGDLDDKQKKDKIKEIESTITTLNPKQPQFFKAVPLSKDRNGGQVKNMANTNATGYAALTKVPNWDTSRWEWLHIRAASLGGATDGSNLVLGTRDANTHMMPFESNIRRLAKIANENENYEGLDVKFSASDQDTDAKHKVNKISIQWKLVKANPRDVNTKEAYGKAEFKPLNTNSNISKKEVDILEKLLKDKREEVKGDNSSEPDKMEE